MVKLSEWYYYREDTVEGPVSTRELLERVDESTLVCRAGDDDWIPACEASLPRAADEAEVEPSPEETPDLNPTLSTLETICRHASNDELLTEYQSHWDLYDPSEREILRKHLIQRGLVGPSDRPGSS